MSDDYVRKDLYDEGIKRKSGGWTEKILSGALGVQVYLALKGGN